jgi:hypothetical protein
MVRNIEDTYVTFEIPDGKFAVVHIDKAYKMNAIVASNVFKIGVSWRCAVSFSLRLL